MPSKSPKGVRNRIAYALGTLLDDVILPGSVEERHARCGEPHVTDLNHVAQDGSRFVSRNNNDRTAHNIAFCEDEAGLAYDETVHWNVIPWWVKDPELAVDGKLRSLAGEAAEARPFLPELLGLIPQVTTVLLLGGQAESAWHRATRRSGPGRLEVCACPHPSPLAFNHPENQKLTCEAFAWAATT